MSDYRSSVGSSLAQHDSNKVIVIACVALTVCILFLLQTPIPIVVTSTNIRVLPAQMTNSEMERCQHAEPNVSSYELNSSNEVTEPKRSSFVSVFFEVTKEEVEEKTKNVTLMFYSGRKVKAHINCRSVIEKKIMEFLIEVPDGSGSSYSNNIKSAELSTRTKPFYKYILSQYT